MCFYGRNSNSQDCSLSIEDVSQTCVNNGVANDRLVMMNNAGVAVPGDSGGPWFFGTKAYGISKGFCFPDFPNRVSFSSVSRVVEALNVEIVCGFACP